MYKIAAINDLSGLGKCSLTVAIPILSALGHEVCPVPTAILSAHTGFPHFAFFDMTEQMRSYIEDWKKQDLTFEAIYTGFLGSEEQIGIVDGFLQHFGIHALKVIDPVMGDNGKPYQTYTPQMCAKMRHLVSRADVITPNLTEAAILLNRTYPEYLSAEQAQPWLEELCAIGPKKAVITGIRRGDTWVNYAWDRDEKQLIRTVNPNVESHYNGTGDMFSSLLTGYLLNGLPFEDAVHRAGIFIHKSVSYSLEQKVPFLNGMFFEPLLKDL